MDAARHWVNGDGPQDELNQDLAAFGVDPSGLVDDEPDPPFLMWPGCTAVLLVFLGLETQWCFTPSGHYSGLNYQSAQTEINMQQIPRKDQRQLWFDLKTMEHAALKAIRNG